MDIIIVLVEQWSYLNNRCYGIYEKYCIYDLRIVNSKPPPSQEYSKFVLFAVQIQPAYAINLDRYGCSIIFLFHHFVTPPSSQPIEADIRFNK